MLNCLNSFSGQQSDSEQDVETSQSTRINSFDCDHKQCQLEKEQMRRELEQMRMKDEEMQVAYTGLKK